MNFIHRRLGVKIAFGINLFVLFMGGLAAFIFILQANAYIEKELIREGQEKSLIGAKMFGTIMEEAVDNGVFSIEDAFDTNYIKIGNYVPPRYHTNYDTYLDKAVLKLQDEFLKDENILYAVGTDRNAYLPTHNTRYQHYFTGNLEKDNASNRTKCIFKDIVGTRAAENTTPGYLQIYNRDTGEVVWDISSPIYVKGDHWGGFRVGMSPEKINMAQVALTHKLSMVTVVILVLFFILNFYISHRLLQPVREVTKTIHDFSVGQQLQTEIKTDRIDEIGELHLAIEDLRKSLARLLKVKKSYKAKPQKEVTQTHLKGDMERNKVPT